MAATTAMARTSPSSFGAGISQAAPEAAAIEAELLETAARHGQTAAAPALDAWALSELDGILRASTKDRRWPGAIVVVGRQGVVGFQGAYGVADIAREAPLTLEHLVPFHSVSKPITAMAFASVMDEYGVTLEDRVDRWIPAFAEVKVLVGDGALAQPDRPLTIRHLLSHTSGLAYGPFLRTRSPGASMEYDDLCERAKLGVVAPHSRRAIRTLAVWCEELAKIPLEFHPGTDFRYGFGHDVVGRIMELVTDETLDQLLQRLIFDQVGMMNTGFVPTDVQKLATVHEPTTQGTLRRLPRPFQQSHSSPIHSGGGGVEDFSPGLMGTCRDLARFSEVLLRRGELDDGRRLCRPETYDLLSNSLLPEGVCLSFSSLAFCAFGYVTLAHADLDPRYRPGEIFICSIGGLTWTVMPAEHMFLISMALVRDDMDLGELVQLAVRRALDASHGEVRQRLLPEAARELVRRLPFDLTDTVPRTVLKSALAPWFAKGTVSERRDAAMTACVQGNSDLLSVLLEQGLGGMDTSSQPPLAFAAALVGHERCLEVLALGNFDVCGEEGTSALCVSALCGHAGVVRQLLGRRAPVESWADESRSALHVAVRSGRVEVVRAFLDVREEESLGLHPLHIACQAGRVDIVEDLLARRIDVGLTDSRGLAPMFCAAIGGHVEVARLLCAATADVRSAREDGRHPLHYTCLRAPVELVRFLLARRADSAASTRCSYLACAAYGNRVDIVSALCDCGYPADGADDLGWTPIHIAAHRGHAAMVQLLCQRRVDANTLMGGQTPLHTACAQAHEAAVRALHFCKANLLAQESLGRCPIHLAASYGDLELLRLLLQRRVNVNDVAADGATALCFAVERDNLPVVSGLLERKATVNKGAAATGPLHKAVRLAGASVVRALLARRADLHEACDSGYALLRMAVDRDDQEILRALLGHRADPTPPGPDDQDLLRLAEASHKHSVARVLRRHADEMATAARLASARSRPTPPREVMPSGGQQPTASRPGSERRLADDGVPYTHEEFLQHYPRSTGVAKWNLARPAPPAGEVPPASEHERRLCNDGWLYTYEEFLVYFGEQLGAHHWQHARIGPGRR